MYNITTGAERMPHDLSHLGFLAGQIGRLITIATTRVIACYSFDMDAVGALRLSPLLRCLSIDSTLFFFFQAEDGIRDYKVTGVQTCALPIYGCSAAISRAPKCVSDGTGASCACRCSATCWQRSRWLASRARSPRCSATA